MRTVLFVMLAGALGCAAPSVPCASSIACGAGRVCGLDGRCGTVEPPGGRAEHRAPRTWAFTERGAPRELERGSDAITLGGPRDGALWLRFDPVLAAPRRAVLVLAAADAASRRAGEVTVVVEEITRGELGRARMAPGAARSVAIEITIEPQRAIELVVRSEAPLEVATPRHVDATRRPRLELLHLE